MGKVIVQDVILRNHEDEVAYKLGNIPTSAIRELKADMIADTGATLVSLSTPLVEQLGLPLLKEVKVKLADGNFVRKAVYDDLTLQIGDRAGIFRVLDSGPAAPLLLGQMVFELLDLVIDCKQQRVIPNPESPDTLLYEMF